jgi:hypothetical protein
MVQFCPPNLVRLIETYRGLAHLNTRFSLKAVWFLRLVTDWPLTRHVLARNLDSRVSVKENDVKNFNLYFNYASFLNPHSWYNKSALLRYFCFNFQKAHKINVYISDWARLAQSLSWPEYGINDQGIVDQVHFFFSNEPTSGLQSTQPHI